MMQINFQKDYEFYKEYETVIDFLKEISGINLELRYIYFFFFFFFKKKKNMQRESKGGEGK